MYKQAQLAIRRMTPTHDPVAQPFGEWEMRRIGRATTASLTFAERLGHTHWEHTKSPLLLGKEGSGLFEAIGAAGDYQK